MPSLLHECNKDLLHICNSQINLIVKVILPQKGEEKMLYCILYCGGKCSNHANNRKDLIEWLKLLKDETITDILKVRKDGFEVSVLDRYKAYIIKSKED